MCIRDRRHVAYCSEYHKGKAKNPKCHSPHIMDADLLKMCIRDRLEVTPKNLRIRKTILNHERRMKAQHGKKN